VDLCGHATLAAAHVLFNHGAFSGEKISFSSKSGLLHVRQDGETLYLDFPADAISKADPPKALIDGLRLTPREVYRGRDDFLAVFEQEKDIRSFDPDMDLISQVPSRGVIVSSPGDDVDFVSRFFAPQSGIPEDPVTGSAHTTLIPYWSKHLAKQQLLARQLSKRGGEIMCRDLEDRVEIGGRAVTYLIGEISVIHKGGVNINHARTGAVQGKRR
jgi:PhzF family phenazine biosynthesis protein